MVESSLYILARFGVQSPDLQEVGERMVLGMANALNSSTCGAEGGGEFKISLDYRAKPC